MSERSKTSCLYLKITNLSKQFFFFNFAFNCFISVFIWSFIYFHKTSSLNMSVWGLENTIFSLLDDASRRKTNGPVWPLSYFCSLHLKSLLFYFYKHRTYEWIIKRAGFSERTLPQTHRTVPAGDRRRMNKIRSFLSVRSFFSVFGPLQSLSSFLLAARFSDFDWLIADWLQRFPLNMLQKRKSCVSPRRGWAPQQ